MLVKHFILKSIKIVFLQESVKTFILQQVTGFMHSIDFPFYRLFYVNNLASSVFMHTLRIKNTYKTKDTFPNFTCNSSYWVDYIWVDYIAEDTQSLQFWDRL